MVTPTAYGVRAAIVADGWPLDEEIEGYVEQLIVDDQIDQPMMFAITMVDPDRNVLDRSGLRVGAEVEISVVDEADEQEKPLAKGTVVTVECEYDQAGAHVTVRGYVSSHRLHRGRNTRTFINSTDSEIVKKVADEAGIDVDEIEQTSEVYDYVAQANASDWEFVHDRAQRNGFELAIVDGKLRFGRPSEASEAPEAPADPQADPADPRQLVSGQNLLAFHGRLSSAAQVQQVEVRGWDSERKKAVVGTAPAGTVAAGLDLAEPSSFAQFFGDHTFVAVDDPLDSGTEVDQAAKALADRIGSSFAEADGVSRGSPQLHAGTAVNISGVGEDFNGKYILSHVRHVIDPDGYHTHFTVSGRHDRSLLGVISSGTNRSSAPARSGSSMRIGGLVRGIVDDNADPDKLGRVKVLLPWMGDDFSTHWAPVMQLGAGPESGTLFIPAVHDEVLVGFEHGAIDRPIVVGGLFNHIDKPPTYDHFLDNGSVIKRAVVSRLGHQLLFNDSTDLSGVGLSTSGGEVNVGLNAGDRKLYLQSDDSIEIVAGGTLKISAAKIQIEADGELVLKGAQIKLN
jgi:phage protein D